MNTSSTMYPCILDTECIRILYSTCTPEVDLLGCPLPALVFLRLLRCLVVPCSHNLKFRSDSLRVTVRNLRCRLGRWCRHHNSNIVIIDHGDRTPHSHCGDRSNGRTNGRMPFSRSGSRSQVRSHVLRVACVAVVDLTARPSILYRDVPGVIIEGALITLAQRERLEARQGRYWWSGH